MTAALELKLKRPPMCGPQSTIGELFVDGRHECATLEDVVREKPGISVKDWKIPKCTAIPRGRYKIAVTWSNRFQRRLPLLLDVPGFKGVRIHKGNHDGDTEGCILVGIRATGQNWIADSGKAFDPLFDKIDRAITEGREVWIDIE